jgi:AcrR family transcriptional regulator
VQKRAVHTRQKILIAAAQGFNAQGYRTSTLRTIANTAGITTGALYFHFKYKEDMAWAILEEQHKVSTLRAKEIVARGLPAIQTMVELIASFAYDILTDPVAHAGVALSTETQIFHTPFIRPWIDWIEAIYSLLQQGIEEGVVDPHTNIEAKAHLIATAFAGVKLGSEIITKNKDLMQRISEMLEAIIPSFVLEAQKDQMIQYTRKTFISYALGT